MPTSQHTSRQGFWRSPSFLVGICALVVLLVVGLESAISASAVPVAIILMEGVAALAVLASASLAGRWILRWLGIRDSWPAEIILGAGVGIGGLSLLVLALGSAGVLNRPVAFVLVGLLAGAGIVRLALDVSRAGCPCYGRKRKPKAETSGEEGQSPSTNSGHDRNSVMGTVPLRRSLQPFHYLWLVVCPFLAITLLEATLPPGVLWKEEGYGYDVLEYHLAVPKTFWQQGRISFLANNVYSNFPLNGEMLFLLLMELRGDAIEAALLATMANVGLGALFVAAAWLAGSTFGQRSGVLAAVLAASTPWVAYLAGIAYVEPGMLAMGMAALACVLRGLSSPRQGEEGQSPAMDRESGMGTVPRGRWMLLAGLLAGFSCGYKYTAVPLIAVPLALFPLVAGLRFRRTGVSEEGQSPSRGLEGQSPSRGLEGQSPSTNSGHNRNSVMGTVPGHNRNSVMGTIPGNSLMGEIPLGASPLLPQALKAWRASVLILAGTLAAFGPWLIRNMVNTHNPVFPLAYSVFGAKEGTWDAELDAKWRRAHESSAAEQTSEPVWQRVLLRTLLDPRFGPLLPALAVAGALRRRDRITLGLLAMLVLQAAVWLLATHLYSRFAVVLLIPAILLAARAADITVPGALWKDGAYRGISYGIVLAAAALHLPELTRLYYHHTRSAGEPLQAFGRVDAFAGGMWAGTRQLGAINRLGGDQNVMMVGEARSFYILPPCSYATVFNRLPIGELAATGPAPEQVLEWLCARRVSHVYVDWSEVGRLRDTYGFYPELDLEFFKRLAGPGLREVESFALADGLPAYATLFEVVDE